MMLPFFNVTTSGEVGAVGADGETSCAWASEVAKLTPIKYPTITMANPQRTFFIERSLPDECMSMTSSPNYDVLRGIGLFSSNEDLHVHSSMYDVGSSVNSTIHAGAS